MKFPPIIALLLGSGLVACGSPSADGPEAHAVSCEDLGSRTFGDASVSSAQLVTAGTFMPPAPDYMPFSMDYAALPAFCRVTGTIRPTADSDIRFELWLPADHWNGRFLQTGNGGAAGLIVYSSMVEPLLRGYAVANTDTGHRGSIADFSWAVGHPEKLTDYQYRAVHELTVAGQAITSAHYGKAPEKAYWLGCSTGGRQGLKEAQRYPTDYDAVVAGAPANNWSPLVSQSMMIEHSIGPGGLGADKLGLLKEAAIAACDDRDGVADRVIGDPRRCDFDPASLQCADGPSDDCLTPLEVRTARKIYAGLVSGTGEVLMPGTGPGSETAWAPPGFHIGTNYYRNVVMQDPDWDPATFDVDADLARAEEIDGGAAKAMDPDLSAFLAHGGKLLLYHGTTDGLIPAGNTVRYFESVVDALGQETVDAGVRFYLVPGMDHCAGGEGAYRIDWLAAMENWVEENRPPAALPASHPAAEPGQAFTRPACAYPEIASYTGNGDVDDAASFACLAP